ncbi:Xaa-Pro dipeptidase [Purpureocillium takamizusanense]|nr:Xaa-Pro dipeptidase [Purpureocillium takamizusanense]UNI16317.1 Xaa-Pro dipeptidase [Purpureocillium takamizusanense]
MRRYDIDEARYVSQLPKYLSLWTSAHRGRTLFALHADQTPAVESGIIDPDTRIDASLLRPAMDRARVIKTDYEVAMVRRANDVSSAGHRKVAQLLLRLATERDVEAVFAAVCTARGARDMAYPVIAGAGENGSILHYGENDQPLTGKQTMVLDAGCEWHGYASDVTRTLPIPGSWTPRAAAIHAIVESMQDQCIAGVRPGARFDHLHMLAEDVAVDGLLRLGILRGDRDDIARAGTIAAFFPHYLGHHVGLEVHDVSGDLPIAAAAQGLGRGLGLDGGKRAMVTPRDSVRMRADKTAGANGVESSTSSRTRGQQELLPNMIVTVEPGIYFCRSYLEGYYLDDPVHSRFIDADVLESYYPVGGVRIEDCILVTRDGYENLTTAPKGRELLDVINGRA